MTRLLRLAADRTGAAAAEMALVVPIFVVLIFGTFELGHFFLSEHVVQKSVRDAARYAARLPVSSFPDCGAASCPATAAKEDEIQNIARSGDPYGQAARRLQGWTSIEMTTVSVSFYESTDYQGIYEEFPAGAPVVTVSAVVPYPTLFATMGLGSASAAECAAGQSDSWTCLKIGARSESAVFGA